MTRKIAISLAIRVVPSVRFSAHLVSVFACFIALLSAGATPAIAQTKPMRAVFDDVHRHMQGNGKSPPREIRLVSGQQTTAEPEDEATEPVLQSPSAEAAPSRVRRSPLATPPQKPEREGAPTDTENLPLPPMEGQLKMAGTEPDPGLQLTKNEQNGLITLIVRDKSLSQVLALIAQTQDLNIVAANDIDALISITLRDVPIEQALTAILSVANYTWVKRDNIILITSMTDATNLPADVQGRQIQVFDLDFTSATVVADSVKNFLSPIGKVSVGLSSPSNNRLTQERVVVEDLPESLCRIADYIEQIDQAPRQVLIEAHVLDVKLKDTNSCGVDLNAFGLNTVFGDVPRLATNLAECSFTSSCGDLGKQ